MTRRFRAPAGNGEVLADPPFAEVPRLIAENRRRLDRADVRIGGLPLSELRALARREALSLVGRAESSRPDAGERTVSDGTSYPNPRGFGFPVTSERTGRPASGLEDSTRPTGNPSPEPDAPLILAGHQPELAHPGVWVKHFALNGLARRVGGVPLNLVVDNDTLKSAALRVPHLSGGGPKANVDAVPFDRLDGETPYEDRRVLDPECFRTFPRRVAEVTKHWPFRPLLPDVWQPDEAHVGDAFTAMRRQRETAWGCDNLELRVGALSQTEAFRAFARHVLADLPRFAGVYNATIRAYRKANRIDSANHPAPDLADGEAPFWVRTGDDGRRARATAASDPKQLRPRALTLTLFARVCLGDFFVHGIGGGKYDEVTDAIVRDYFGVEPPAYQVLSATLHLPLPGFAASDADVKRREWLVRDLRWNPQRHLGAENARRPEVRALVAERAARVAAEPPLGDRAARRAWFRALQALTERLRPFVWKQVAPAKGGLSRARVEAAANAVLRRRDYAWVLYPEDVLRPYLQRFLEV